MNRLLFYTYRTMVQFGLNPRQLIRSIRGVPAFIRDLSELERQKASRDEFPLRTIYPCLGDRYAKSGVGEGHYFHQDLLVARRIYLNHPTIHVDVGSRIDGFVAHVASFRPIRVIDIRPQVSNIPNMEFVQADIMQPLSNDMHSSCDSLSCLHTLEHLGLGRYGDSIKYDGYLVGLDSLLSMLKSGGKLYLSVPIGPQRIEFNAHRVFSVAFLLPCFSGHLEIDQFSFVDDAGLLHENVPLDSNNVNGNFGCTYGCGIFEMTKR